MKDSIAFLLQDSSAIWEAMSVDGVSYPFNDNRVGLSEEERNDVQDKVNCFDNMRAKLIGAIIADASDNYGMKQDGCDRALGAIVRKQILGHLERIAAANPRFENVFCSSCGEGFGAGDSGFSHCEGHLGMEANDE